MKRSKIILLGTVCILVLVLSWLTAITAQTDAERQEELLQQAEAYIKDEIYIRAVPLLEEAAGYYDKHTLEAEEMLKKVYLQLIDQSGYAQKYASLLEKQMARENAPVECFQEAAEYYFGHSRTAEAFAALRNGISKTGSAELESYYESIRYQFKMQNGVFQDVATACNGAVQVKANGYWGLANTAGELVIPCEYDKVSTYSDGEAIVKKNGIISGIDSDNNRVALLHEEASDFGNYNEERLGLKTDNGWLLSDGDFNTGTVYLEELGMYSDGGAPAEINGKWGILNSSGSDWLIPAEYDGIVQDELGRAYKKETVFVKKENNVILLVKGKAVGDVYEDAHPFADGWAAVKKDGKWGFIDQEGGVQIDYQFDDAQSFGQHLAAVKVNGKWGYVSLKGDVVIAPEYLNAKSFCNGSAPVKTETGWRFITLLEYEEGASL